MKIAKIADFQFEVWDAGTGIPLLFIHGIGTSGELWAANLAELTNDFRIIVYNRRGYGASSSSPRNWVAHVEDAIALIEGLNAVPCVVAGYSAGAIIALDVALRRPDLISRIVLLDPGFNLKRCLTPGFVRTVAAVKLLRWLRRDRSAVERWFRYVTSYPTGGSAYEAKASDMLREQLLARADSILDELASAAGVTLDENRLSYISLPVTIVDARLSPPFLRRSSRRLKQLLPQARNVTLENSGHWIALDARDELLKVLRDAAQ